MKPEIEKGIQICIDAINDKNIKGGDVFVLDILNQLAKEPYSGCGLGIGSSECGLRSAWEDKMKSFFSGIRSILDWENALLMLFDWEKLNEVQMLEYAQNIADTFIFNHVLEHIIENLTAEDEISKAQEYTLLFRPYEIDKYTDAQETGYRVILRYYARKGDADNFFKTLKLCKPSQKIYIIDEAKIKLLQTVCENKGIETAIKLCSHKNMGERFYFDALSVVAENGEYSALKKLFEKYPELKQPEKETELHILSLAYSEAAKRNIETEDDFEILFDRALNIDAKMKWGDAKTRDVILFVLGLASRENKERFLRCRKAIKNNSIKRELSDICCDESRA